MWNPRLSSRPVTSVAVLALIGTIGLSACGGSGGQESATDAAAGPAVGGKGAATTPAPSSMALQDGLAATYTQRSGLAVRADLLNSGRSVIRTGSVALRSDRIDHVLTRVYGIVGGVGGDVAREETATDAKGAAVRSTLALQVPVADFDTTLDDLSRLGALIERVRNAKDVTTEVADIDSRVRSAHRSIATLRRLFGRAGKLGDIIRLESELSQREADLEALQAQQRSLHDQTTMSTITMTVERLRLGPAPTHRTHTTAGGFVSGIREGWHALTRTMLAIGHGLGVVLPLGTVVLLLAALALWFVRRFVPGLAAAAKPTAES